MEEHFLKELVFGESQFSPEPWYNPHGDCIMYTTVDEEVIAQRFDELLTIYISASSGKPIGFQIKGVRAIINKFGLGGVEVECEESKIVDVKFAVGLSRDAIDSTGPISYQS